MFDGIEDRRPTGRLYRITRQGAAQWRVMCPDRSGPRLFARIDDALDFVRTDCGQHEGTVELLADDMYVVKYLGGGMLGWLVSGSDCALVEQGLTGPRPAQVLREIGIVLLGVQAAVIFVGVVLNVVGFV